MNVTRKLIEGVDDAGDAVMAGSRRRSPRHNVPRRPHQGEPAVILAQQVNEVYLDDLTPNPDNPRTDIGDITELAASIAYDGLYQPLIVVDTGSDGSAPFMIVDGHRRHAALASLDWEDTIPVRVVEMDRTDRLIAALTTGTHSKPLDPIDEARAYQALVDLDLTQRQIAERVGCNQSHISRRLALLELDDTTAAKVTSGEVKVRDAEAVARGKTPPAPKKRPTIDERERAGISALEAENARLRDLAARSKTALQEARDTINGDLEEERNALRNRVAELEADATMHVVEPGVLREIEPDLFFWTKHYNNGAVAAAWLTVYPDRAQALRRFERHLVDEVVRLAGCALPACAWDDNEPCTHGYVPKPIPVPTHVPAAAQLDRPGQHHLTVPTTVEDRADALTDDEVHNLFTPPTDAPGIEPAPVDPTWATKPPWPPYPNQDADRILSFITHTINKPDTLRHVVEYEQHHNGRADIIDAAIARLHELTKNAA